MYIVTFHHCHTAAKYTRQPAGSLSPQVFKNYIWFREDIYLFYSAHTVLFILCHFMNSLPQILSILGFHCKHLSLKYDLELTVHICRSGKADPGSVIAFCLLHHIFFKIWCLFAITFTESWGGKNYNMEQLKLEDDCFWTSTEVS